MREGELLFPDEPALEVTAPVIEAQMVETAVINAVNLQTMFATKATRVLHAAQGRTVADFAARRTHGREAADRLARASYIAGFIGTSNVQAAARYGITPIGTMAHSLIAAFPTEADAFDAYAESFPDTATLLVDTYDTVNGTRPRRRDWPPPARAGTRPTGDPHRQRGPAPPLCRVSQAP